MQDEDILKVAISYASAFTNKDEQDGARIAFVHGAQWMQSKVFKVAKASMMEYRIMRVKAGLTLRDVELATGLSNPYLSQLETGKIKRPSQYAIDKLNDYYSTLDIPE